MGSELGEQPTYTSLKDYFDDLFSYALSLGMSYKEFWEEDVYLLNNYVKAEEIKQKKRNTELWLQGMYFQSALNSSLSGLFGKHNPYLKQPIPLTKKEQEDREEEKLLKFRNQLISLAKGGKKDG